MSTKCCILCSNSSTSSFESVEEDVDTTNISTDRNLLAETLCKILQLPFNSFKERLSQESVSFCSPCTNTVHGIHVLFSQLENIQNDLNHFKRRIEMGLKQSIESRAMSTSSLEDDNSYSSVLRIDIINEVIRMNPTPEMETIILCQDTTNNFEAKESSSEEKDDPLVTTNYKETGGIEIYTSGEYVVACDDPEIIFEVGEDHLEDSICDQIPSTSNEEEEESSIQHHDFKYSIPTTTLLVQVPQRRQPPKRATRKSSRKNPQSESGNNDMPPNLESQGEINHMMEPGQNTETLPLLPRQKRKTANSDTTAKKKPKPGKSSSSQKAREFLVCPVEDCKFKFDKSLPDVELRLDAHVKRKHEGIRSAYKCPLCPKTFNYRRLQVAHTMLHTGENPYMCEVCGRGFRVARYLRFHMRIHTGDRRFPCPTCDFKCLNKQALKVHMLTHTKTKAFMCEICSMSFLRNYDLLNHQKKHHSSELDLTPYKCRFCEKILCGKFSLKWHEKMHTGDLEFECSYPECSFRSSTRQRITLHEKSHTLERTFKCDQCESSYKHKQHLLVHLRVHTGERPYKCKSCDKAFRASSHLSFHEKLHSGELKFKCPHCPEAFVLRKYMNRHVEKHRKGKLLPHIVLNEDGLECEVVLEPENSGAEVSLEVEDGNNGEERAASITPTSTSDANGTQQVRIIRTNQVFFNDANEFIRLMHESLNS